MKREMEEDGFRKVWLEAAIGHAVCKQMHLHWHCMVCKVEQHKVKMQVQSMSSELPRLSGAAENITLL
jgi:hypothetical protein